MIGPHLALAEVVPAAPAAAGVAFGLATLATLLAFLACWGLRHAWSATIGYGLRWIASEIRDVSIPTGFFGSIHPFGRLADLFEAVDHFVAHALAVAALNSQHAFIYCAHTTAHIFVWTGHEIARLARDTLQFAEHLYSHSLPKWRREIIHQAAHATDVAVGKLRSAERAADRRLHREIEGVRTRVLHAVRAVAGTLDHVIPQVHGLERDFTGLRARIRSLEKRLTPAALVALIGATIFQHFGMEWLRCKSNPFMNNRNACALWGDLSELLGLAVAALAFSDLEDLLKTAEAIEGEVITLARDALNIG